MTLRWTPEAVEDLARLYGFLATKNVRAALQMVNVLRDAVRQLLVHPRLGSPLAGFDDREMRRLLMGAVVLWLVLESAERPTPPPGGKIAAGGRLMANLDSLLSRISANPEIFGGKPIIRGMRISVELILSLLAQGESADAILDDYTDLEPDDIRACLAYAHAAIAHDSLEAVQVSA